MASLYGRYYSDRDLRLINSVNAELMGTIIQCLVVIYKVVVNDTKINLYGESDPKAGKVFFPGISITALYDKHDIETTADEFGTDRKQIIQFRFRENMLKELNLFPEVGDIIDFNDRLHEIDGVNQEQFLGSIPEKSLSIICDTHYSRLTRDGMFVRS